MFGRKRRVSKFVEEAVKIEEDLYKDSQREEELGNKYFNIGKESDSERVKEICAHAAGGHYKLALEGYISLKEDDAAVRVAGKMGKKGLAEKLRVRGLRDILKKLGVAVIITSIFWIVFSNPNIIGSSVLETVKSGSSFIFILIFIVLLLFLWDIYKN